MADPDFRPGSPATEELLGQIAQLREHCPWMGALTHASLVEYLLEEAYEVIQILHKATSRLVRRSGLA